MDLYRYTGNGPTDATDPSGLGDWPRKPMDHHYHNFPGAGLRSSGMEQWTLEPTCLGAPDASDGLDQGDLVIIMDSNKKDFWERTDQDNEKAVENSMTNRQKLNNDAGYKKFTIAPGYASSQKDIADAINTAVKKNGGKPFRRILVFGHAGADGTKEEIDNDFFTPSIKLGGGDRLHSDNISTDLKTALDTGLIRGGILVLGTCGHGTNDMLSWTKRIQKWADELQVAVAANPDQVYPQVGQGTTDIKKRFTAYPR